MTLAAECSKCHLPIRWCRTKNDRLMPLDQEPNVAGNVICEYGEGGVLRGIVLVKGDPRPAGVAFMPHFATCLARPRKPKKQPKPKPEAPPSLFNEGATS